MGPSGDAGPSAGLLRPGDAGFAEAARAPFIARDATPVPAAVACCASTDDVVEALALVRRDRPAFAVRSGGHSAAGQSSTDGLLIDLSGLDSVRLQGDLAVAGPGTRLGALAEELARHGRAVPAGVCPTVGLSGLALGGGWGLLGRVYGLTCDHLESAEVVLADGRVVTASRESEPDLLWALRGAGRHFGVVTSMVLRTRPAPSLTNFHYGWSYAHAARLVDVWQRWAPDAPRQLTASLLLSAPADAGRPASAELVGAMVGSPGETARHLAEFCARAGADPERTEMADLGYLETARYQGTLTATGAGSESRYRVTASEFFDRPLPDEAIERLVERLAEARREGESRDIELAPWGGAYRDVRWHASAFVHRERRFSVEHIALADDPDPARRWVRRSRAALQPWGTGSVYQNAPDPELEDQGLAYYGANLARLRELKARYDPEGVFPSLG